LARDVLFDEEEFFDGKPVRFTDILINNLDKVIEEVSVTPDPNLKDIQLREDESEVKDENEIEGVNEREDIKGLPKVEKEPEPEENNWETSPYLSLDPTIDSSFLSWLDEALPVRSEEVKAAAHLDGLPDKLVPDLPDILDYEPAILDKIRRQREDRFSDFHQHQVPQAWHTAFQAGSTNRRNEPPAPKNLRPNMAPNNTDTPPHPPPP
jgi:hypothetical protein